MAIHGARNLVQMTYTQLASAQVAMKILEIVLLCHLGDKTWFDDAMQTRPIFQILLFLWNISLVIQTLETGLLCYNRYGWILQSVLWLFIYRWNLSEERQRNLRSTSVHNFKTIVIECWEIEISLFIKEDPRLGPSHLIHSKHFKHFALDNIYELTKFHDHILYSSIDMLKTVPSRKSQYSWHYEFWN